MNQSEKFYPVTSVAKEDLLSCLPDEVERIDALSDADMERIAGKLGDALQETFWIALEVILTSYLDKIPTTAEIQPDSTALTQEILSISPVTREDVQQAGFSDAEIAQLTNEDLKRIARTMAAHYQNDVFWDDLRHIVELILEEKKRP